MADQYARRLLTDRLNERLRQGQKPIDPLTLLKNPVMTPQSQQDIMITVGPVHIPVNLTQSFLRAPTQLLISMRDQLDRIIKARPDGRK